MRLASLATLLLVASASLAHANGRPSATSTINFRQGHESDVIAGMTFGAVISHDSGATWHWFCEDAVGYAGVYDPDYAYSQSGAIFATTFAGLVENRNGCTFDATPMGTKFASSEELGPLGSLHVALANSCGSGCVNNDVKIYRSDDDGVTFPISANVGILNDWWQTIQVAKSDANRVYISGYRFVEVPDLHDHLENSAAKVAHAGTMREHLLFVSTNKGVSFSPMSVTGLVASENSIMEIAGISPTNPDIVYLRITYAHGVIGDSIYRSVNAGQTWTLIHEKQDSLNAFVVRSNGDVVVAAPSFGASLSTNCKTTNDACTFTALPNAPHLNCLYENTAHEVWGCTLNYGGNQLPSDGYGIMKTTDLVTWNGVLKFQDIAAPVDCPVGTVQRDTCYTAWCALRTQLGITADPTMCPPPPDLTDGETEGGTGLIVKKPEGCCSVGSDALPGTIVGVGLVGFAVLRRRRRKECCN